MKPLVIIGAGGLAREVAWLVEENNKLSPEWNIMGYVSKETGSKPYKYPILGDDDWLLSFDDQIYALMAIGSSLIRRELAEKYKRRKNIIFPSMVSKHALVADSSEIGSGVIVCPGSIITVDVHLGDFCICDRNSNVGHGSELGDYVIISPGVNISGDVRIGECSMIGTGTSIIQGITVGSNTVIGAGAVVIDDIPDNTKAVGVPARTIKKNV